MRSCTVGAIALALVTAPAAVAAQSVSGAMAVAASILPPNRSQIVIVTLSSPTNSVAPVVQAPPFVPARRERAAASDSGGASPPRPSYEAHVGRPLAGPDESAVSVRVSYLIIPGGT